MFPRPDISTLTLCSLLASVAFALVFLALWSGRREARHLLHWSASSGSYALTLVGFQLLAHLHMAGLTSLLCGMLAASNVLLVSGVRAFHGVPPFRRWMIVPPALAFAGDAAATLAAATGRPVATTVALIAETGGIALGCAICGVMLLRQGRGEGYGGQRIAGAAVLGYLPAYLAVIAGELSSGALDRAALASLPMMFDQLLLGVLYFGLLSMPGERAQRELRALALHDPLTRALNRAGLAACGRTFLVPGAAVVAIDIDRFKALNDGHGHGVGDAVLVRLCDAAAGLLCPGGRLVRLGGDEFLVLLPGGGIGAADAFVRGLRAAVTGDASLPPWSFSAGAADIKRTDTSMSEVIRRADLGLYREKQRERPRLAA